MATKLPKAYAWLEKEPAPRMLLEALKLVGTKETKGNANNPAILAWARECGIKGYGEDSIPWCGLFVAVCAKRAGKPIPSTPLWARSWRDWGNGSSTPQLGDVLVFSRDGGGHVGLYVGEDSTAYHVLGGNQGDEVNIKRVAKDRLIAARNLYQITTPDNIRRIHLSGSGTLSTNEA